MRSPVYSEQPKTIPPPPFLSPEWDFFNTGYIKLKTPKISVIIPVYNGEKYLEYCIASILMQKYKDLEINTSVEIINSDEKRAGAKFIPQDKTVLNDLLYLSIQLEFDNGLLVTRLKEG
jgi:cellulose synthase/poly-beta-1,6-N-acetylglucosamine synthase-like glycosyltransferase